MEYLVFNSWKVFFHKCFTQQLTSLAQSVQTLKDADPQNYQKKADAKLLAGIIKSIKDRIAADPQNPGNRIGKTLGEDNKQWYRVKLFQQYRIFYRFSTEHKVIIIGWINDSDTLRAYGSKTDAYKTFKDMLSKGNPPGDWDSLYQESLKSTSEFSNPLFP